MFDALHESLRGSLIRQDAERRLPWGDRLDAHVTPPSKDYPFERRTWPPLQRITLAEAISGCLTTRTARSLDTSDSPHVDLGRPDLVWLARYEPRKPLDEPAAVFIPRVEYQHLLNVDAVLVADASQWDHYQGHREWHHLVRIVDYGLSLLMMSEKGLKKRPRRVTDPRGVVARWGAGALADTRELAREIEAGRQMELAMDEAGVA